MEVRPFKALRFDPKVVGDVGKCIAPPYDVIGVEQQEALYERSPYNIARIIRGKTNPSDNGQSNQYTRAAEYLRQWMAEGALKAEAEDSIYGYVHDFELNGTAVQRLSFIAVGKLEDFGRTVKPHEQIFEKPMRDRLNLKKATAAHFGLVFMLYEDPETIADKIIQQAAEQPPLIDFVDDQAVRHRLFAVTDDSDISAVAEMMAEKSCIIADGHHRYTTGLNYSRQSDNPAAQYQMLAFTNLRQKGFVVLGTHRVVGGIGGFEPQAVAAKFQSMFDLVAFKFDADSGAKERAKQSMLAEMKAHHDDARTTFGLYMADGAFYIATLKDARFMAAAAPGKSRAWQALDVSVLQKLVLEGLFQMSEEQLGRPDCVTYVKDTPNAVDTIIADVEAGRKQIAFFTNPVRMPQLVEVTEAGERMPQKSTYFYPKMYTGLTIQKL